MRPEVGSPQGSPISPLLANVYLNALDRAWEDGHGGLGVLVRYSDDLVILCRTKAQAEAAMRELRALLAELRLELADAKTRLVYLDNDGEGSFDFLGFHHQMVESFSKPGWHFLARWPSAAATQAARQKIRELTDRRLLRLPVEDVVTNLNRFLTGWAGYFRRGNSTTQFHKLDLYTAERLARWIGMRHKARRPLALWLLAAAPGTLLRPTTTRRTSPPRRRACGQVKGVGAPCEGKPHARCEVAAGGNQRQSAHAARCGRLPPTLPYSRRPPGNGHRAGCRSRALLTQRRPRRPRAARPRHPAHRTLCAC